MDKQFTNQSWFRKTFRKLLFLVFVFSLVCSSTALADVEINKENFPDANFRQYIVKAGFDQDKSGSLSEEEIGKITKMDCSNKGISSLEGIESFTALQVLNCSFNQLTSLDVSRNTTLTELYCNNNRLTSLSVSQNTALTKLLCSSNQLTSLDVSGCTALTMLYCAYNQLASLDVSRNTALGSLLCASNRLTGLDVSKSTALTALWCYSNRLTSLDVSGCTALTDLSCESNQLTTLDLTQNAALLEEISKYEPQEEEGVIYGTRKDEDTDDYSTFFAVDANVNVLPAGTVPASFPLAEVEINEDIFPDANFRQWILKAGFDQDKSGSLSEEEIGQVTKMDCSNQAISSLEGIESFTALQVLNCTFNQLTSLDVSKNTALIEP